ncbi:aldehyde dehydrogenase family protein [Mycobacterium seoulense]|uniref:aldehyde dehydrogenase family protein n=1 Tax=Mycobacterium TaxID=1763 RepID=UPI00138BDBBD|nr:hypothetical protein MPRS_16620 [Mycobacterium paraseoulense]
MPDDYEGRLFIDGEFREARSGERYDVFNPADESVVGTAADASADDVDDAITAARRAADETDWGTNHEFRRRCLEQLQLGLRKESQELRDVVTAEAGVVSSVIYTHVDFWIDGMDYFNDLCTSFPWEEDLPPYEVMGMPSAHRVRYEPYGVVGAITPWNAPFMTGIWKMHHALATGNTVVLKSAPDTPLTAALLAKIAAETTDIPAGVINTLSGADKSLVGDAMTADQRIDLYHFTGSAAVGQRITERAANGIRHTVLELGGKSANIVLPDANLDMACGMGVAMCMSSSGQGCALGTRLVVHADIYDEVLERLTGQVGSLPWGDPKDPANVVGPIIRLEQLERMEGLVNRAVEAGARLLCGGKRGDRNGKGFWYEPTVLADVDEKLRDRADGGLRPGSQRHPLRGRRRRTCADRQQFTVRPIGIRAIRRRGARMGGSPQAQGRNGEHQQLVLSRSGCTLRWLWHQRRRRRARYRGIPRLPSHQDHCQPGSLTLSAREALQCGCKTR